MGADGIYEYLKRQAKAEKELEVERWAAITIESKERGLLYRYDLPVHLTERWEWVIRWRLAKLICKYPKDNIRRYYAPYYKRKGVYMGYNEDFSTLISAKAQVTKAENAIKKYCDDSQFGALGVSYSGINLDVANEVNKTLIPLFEEYDVGKIGGILAPAGNTKLGKQMTNAIAGYSPIRKSFVLNRKALKNMKTAQEAFEAEGAVLKDVLEQPEKYDFTKTPKSVLSVIERSKKSGRATVPKTVQEAIQHEFGHFIQHKVYASNEWGEAEANMAKYADGISGYAGTNKNEYVAVSFVSYLKGEGVVDPVLAQIFDDLRRK